MIVNRYHNCKSSGGNLQRKIYEAYDSKEVKQRMAIVSYEWAKDVEPHEFEILAHGNTERNKAKRSCNTEHGDEKTGRPINLFTLFWPTFYLLPFQTSS